MLALYILEHLNTTDRGAGRGKDEGQDTSSEEHDWM